jgi:hypothetical protein
MSVPPWKWSAIEKDWRVPNPEWEECKTCDSRDLYQDQETLAEHRMSGQTFCDPVTHDAEAFAFSERRTEELLELQRQTAMDVRRMIQHGLLNGATWALSRNSRSERGLRRGQHASYRP